MKFASFALSCAAVLLSTACGDLLSLHPLHTARDQVFDPALEGRWENDDDLLTIERVEDRYEATLQSRRDASESHKYEVHLTDIKGVRFADLLWEDGIGHMFVRTQITPAELRLTFLDSEWLRQRVPHEESEVDGGRTQAVVTARTPQLRSMVAKYALEPKAYDPNDVVFRRAK
jgi:hypothetical protein